MRLVVCGLPITHHGHDVRERNSGAIVLVSVEENTETFESIGRAEDRTLRGAFLGEPERKAISVQVAGAVDLKFELNLADIRELFVHVHLCRECLITCQLVAVRGTREAIHPCCDGRSAVRRIYLNTKAQSALGLPK